MESKWVSSSVGVAQKAFKCTRPFETHCVGCVLGSELRENEKLTPALMKPVSFINLGHPESSEMQIMEGEGKLTLAK